MYSEKPEQYDVFLSYSHEDAKKYGSEIIDRIKHEIEAELQDHACRSLVFLDAKALNLGDEWQAKIREKINECKIFICLISENYLRAPYCARERLWWAQKEIWNGRLRKTTLPVYYVELDRDPWSCPTDKTKDLFGFQLEQDNLELLPWINGKEDVKKLFVEERLNVLKGAVKRKLRRESDVKSFSSVTPGLSESFVGRIQELKELREICVSGHYPIIQAAGGVGKSELAVAYAFGYAEDYPNGRFLIRMEGVNTWKSAILSMVRDSKTGRRTREYLGVSDDDMTKSDEELHVQIVRKLFELAKDANVLLLLDNVDDSSIFSAKKLLEFSPEGEQLPPRLHMVGTSRHFLEYPERNRAQAVTIGNLSPEEAFELFCLIGGKVFPFAGRPDLGNDPESQALKEIISLLDGHVWSMEILAGYMVENYGNGMTFVKKLSELQRNCIIDGEGSWRNVGNSVVLLKPTLERIRGLNLGDAIIDVLAIASLMYSDVIYIEVLEAYWRRYHSHLEYKDGVPFDYVINALKKYHLLNGDGKIRKIHRITQAAVKDIIGERISEYTVKLAPILEKAYVFSQEDWCDAIITTPELYAATSQEFKDYKFRVGNWIRLLQNPIFEEYCPWEKLNREFWFELLGVFPTFIRKCPSRILKNYTFGKGSLSRYRNIRDGELYYLWTKLLIKQPQLGSICPYDDLKLYLSRSVNDVLRTIELNSKEENTEIRPNLLGYENCSWDEINVDTWVRLLIEQPQLADKCKKWDEFSEDVWSELLCKQPQFADRCPWRNLMKYKWGELLIVQPQFVDKCPWDKLPGGYLVQILKKSPQYVSKCPSVILGVIGADWVDLLLDHPQIADKCQWENLTEFDWKRLLCVHPHFANKCQKWDEFNVVMWMDILIHQPRFADRCPWEKLREKLSPREWLKIISERPQFANRCPLELFDEVLSIFGERMGVEVQKLKHIDKYKLWDEVICKMANDCKQKMESSAWVRLLSLHPEEASSCPWSKLKGRDWVDLLMEQPQFAEYCQWEKIPPPPDCYWLVDLVRKQPQLEHIINESLKNRGVEWHCDWWSHEIGG